MNIFFLQVIISFFAGGLFISLQTIFAEHVNPKWRGMILTLPSTTPLGIFFIALTKSVNDIPDVIRIVPGALAVTYLFVLVFSYFSQLKSLYNAFIFSFAIWAIGAYVLLIAPPESFLFSTFFYFVPIIIFAYFLIRRLPHDDKLTPVPFNYKHVIIRGLIAGTIVGTTVVFSKTLGNTWGGLFSTFPATFTSAFLIYSLVHGRKIIPSVGKSLFFPGSIGFIIYSGLAGIVLPKFGIWIGTVVSYLITLAFYFLYFYIKNKTKIFYENPRH